ncbi:uncharacterized protein SPPG_08162 [Spizellomyces punctatus DAOM BR117]|uniref:Glycosyltransferase 2-like domain-containing protein n=1 Tax=Spizellomyces punctatus (strain DAOM BR117) TaxID=645134 RepID=A0A0L0H5V7_SPIPD|nr:uncharacterized protein SPPG_08162 [Spizellomyces punctatus DAOM BR117]KNC96577.1 hypothetical protein SPPG_08162 [Spizellomyces punctatus DAOM BR117]|eukprot:XP_016604617.1 hypothetical protein SPPG_08162 [Spizellomyces punctatus DAOM BR117]
MTNATRSRSSAHPTLVSQMQSKDEGHRHVYAAIIGYIAANAAKVFTRKLIYASADAEFTFDLALFVSLSCHLCDLAFTNALSGATESHSAPFLRGVVAAVSDVLENWSLALLPISVFQILWMLHTPCAAILRYVLVRSRYGTSSIVFHSIWLLGIALATQCSVDSIDSTALFITAIGILLKVLLHIDCRVKDGAAGGADTSCSISYHRTVILAGSSLLLILCRRGYISQFQQAFEIGTIGGWFLITCLLTAMWHPAALNLRHSSTVRPRYGILDDVKSIIVVGLAFFTHEYGWIPDAAVSMSPLLATGMGLIAVGVARSSYIIHREAGLSGAYDDEVIRGSVDNGGLSIQVLPGPKRAEKKVRTDLRPYRKRGSILLLSTIFLLGLFYGMFGIRDNLKRYLPEHTISEQEIDVELWNEKLPDTEEIITDNWSNDEEFPFGVSSEARPRRLHDSTFYTQTPIHPARPRNQFVTQAAAAADKPMLTLLTVTQNPRPLLETETTPFVRQQSLQAFKWVIVNDHSDKPEALEMLNRIAALDSRITIVNNTGERGVSAARTFALQHVNTPYQAFLDDDDLRELVAYEQAVWLLETNPHLDIASWYMVTFGTSADISLAGPHMGSKLKKENTVPSGAVVRHSATRNCSIFDPVLTHGGEDYDFWLCLAESGSWGATIPEYSYWYRIGTGHNWSNFGKAWEKTHAYINEKHSGPQTWPAHDIPASQPFESIEWLPPFLNSVAPSSKRRALFLIDSFRGDIPGRRILGMVGDLARLGWRITVVAVLNQSDELRSEYYMYTHDIFVLPMFLRTVDFPRFLVYLTNSRRIQALLISESVFGYDALPSLCAHLPRQTAVFDYVHAADMGWRSGGFATMSALNGNCIYRTMTGSPHVHDIILQRNGARKPDSVLHLERGINIMYLSPKRDLNAARRAVFKGERGVSSACVVAYTGTVIDASKVVDIALALKKLLKRRTLVMVPLRGTPLQNAVRQAWTATGRSEVVNFFEEEYMSDERYRLLAAASNVVLALSLSSVDTALLAMASGVPVVSSQDIRSLLPETSGNPLRNMNSTNTVSELASDLFSLCDSTSSLPVDVRRRAAKVLQKSSHRSQLAAILTAGNDYVRPNSNESEMSIYNALATVLNDERRYVDAYEQQIRLPGYHPS